MAGRIYVGIGGWTYEPWRGPFYPDGLSQKRELEYAASKLTSIEVNGTYYGSQKPETYRKWREETPDEFLFTLKGSRYCTNRKDLSLSAESVDRFLNSGITELGAKLGPLNWQFMATKKFDPVDFENFLKLLPPEVDGVKLRHAVEVRHNSFCCAEFVDLCRRYGVAIITGVDDPDFPVIADLTTDFGYVRLMGSQESEPLGYTPQALDEWAYRARTLAEGQVPNDLATFGGPRAAKDHDVFFYVIGGHKVVNPQTAMALIERLA
ncbi:hypothetical protein ABI_29320 [Asticcacaulis biprosthecium C19]|uniref:DUF72 domain-containing protein n=1 Tax=Asticcacaulis biprosthecium C19 TaxID=715226 RepID=F4QMS4_9CAUL|nr:DUF72 domain-containing protein [Asticcacaulis biprosthecium]EGF91515.1 hypothetical protein ABI_29320 [Asticcacaulis biprosthecium C19]